MNYISEISNTLVDNAHDINAVRPMYNLIEYSVTYSKTSERLWQYYRNETVLNDNGNIICFPYDNNNSI